MVPTKKRTSVAVAVGVWIAALGSAAALTYDLNRTPRPASETSRPTTPSTAAPVAVVQRASEPQPILYIPTITIVGSIRRSVADAPRPEGTADTKMRDISKMRCEDWRGLDIGSGHVQVCE
jgi:hypothetical protein